ncbi:hypothetical protein N7530_010523 [Penicillium desertorum]|uniref:Uncharacterized protein n=1 Tax=Penicillium desertorum TaxID=1303715 RepID=A0A9W9WI58_9EURO|nr:hypothetical protein N7530_010523 [Penicillium desertorum]
MQVSKINGLENGITLSNVAADAEAGIELQDAEPARPPGARGRGRGRRPLGRRPLASPARSFTGLEGSPFLSWNEALASTGPYPPFLLFCHRPMTIRFTEISFDSLSLDFVAIHTGMSLELRTPAITHLTNLKTTTQVLLTTYNYVQPGNLRSQGVPLIPFTIPFHHLFCDGQIRYKDSTPDRSYDRPHLEERAGARPKPGDPRTFLINVGAILRSSLYENLEAISRGYPTGLNVLKGDGASTLGIQGGFTVAKDVCSATGIQLINAADLPKTGMHAEHIQGFNIVARFLETTLSGKLPGGLDLKAPTLDAYKLLAGWHKTYDVSLPLAGVKVTDVKGWAAGITPNDRIFEIFGSYSYRTGMSLLGADMNLMKMAIFTGHRTMGIGKFEEWIAEAADGKLHGAKMILGKVQKVYHCSVELLELGELRPYLDQARAQLATEIGYADKYIPELKGMSAIWKEFEPAFYNHIVSTSQKYVTNRIAEIAQKFPLGNPTGNDAVTKLSYGSEELKKSISQITFHLKK